MKKYHLTGNGYDKWEITLHSHGKVTSVKVFDAGKRIRNIDASRSVGQAKKTAWYLKAKQDAEEYLQKLNKDRNVEDKESQ